jgi:site-specific DNA recombinase
MRAEVGPSFRFGALMRRSEYNADGTEESTARQEDEIFRWVEQRKEGRIVAVYKDIASAYSEKSKRPEFENALDDVRAGRIDGIIVWKLDRLSRRTSEIRRITTFLEDHGSRLVSIHENIDTADPVKKEITNLLLAVLAGQAQAESESISARVRLHHYDMARKGIVQTGGKRPFGHTGEGWSELEPAEVKILHEAGERILEGESGYSIARDFTEREIPTATGATRWYSEVLMRMLRSPRMIGMQEYGGKLYPYNDVPAIFERDEWEHICAKLERRPATPSETRLLSNMALCAICSNHLRASGKGNLKGRRQRDPGEFSYRCRRKTMVRDDGACGKVQITGSLADEEVSRRTIAYISDRDKIRRILLTYADKANLDAIQARVAQLTEDRQALYDARFTPPPGMPRLPDSIYYEKLKAIEDERNALMRSSVVTREAGMLAELLELEDVEAEWNARPVQWRRAILKLVTLSIVIEPRGKGCEPGTRPHERRFDPTRIKIAFADE